jgi:hypothetical protein
MTENVIPRIPSLDYDPTFGELVGAAFRTENVVGSAIQRLGNSRMFGDSDPTPVTDADINTEVEKAGLTNFIGHFTDVQTRGDLNNKLAHIGQQAADKQMLDNGGWTGFGTQLMAGVIDVPTLIPFGHAARLGKLGTESLRSTASKLAMTAALDAGATEAALHLTQDLRTKEESALAIGGSMLLTTTIGTGLARYLSRRHFDDLSKRVEDELPKIADGRAEAEVAHQFAQASDNTVRAMRGERLEPQLPWRDEPPGSRAASFLETQGVKADDLSSVDTSIGLNSLLIGADGKLYDLNKRWQTHADWMRAVDESGDAHLSSDMGNVLQVTLARDLVGGKADVTFSTGSQSPLTRKQLQGIRKLAKHFGIDQRELYFREDRTGGVEVMRLSLEEKLNPNMAGFNGLSRYSSAENRAKAAEKAGTPPEDPELRQGLPTTRWDGEATSKPGVTYKTAKGSTYVVHEDGTTTRNKAARNDPGHEGDYGPKPRSEKTVYVPTADAQRFAGPASHEWRVIDHGDGTLSLATKRDDGRWGIAPESRNVPVSDKPAVGLSPVELWGKGEVYGREAYSKIHLGNQITDIADGATDATTGGAVVRTGGNLVGSPPAGGRGGGGEPPNGGLPPPGGPEMALPGPFEPIMSPSQMAFANSGGAIAATRGLTRLFGGSPILEMMNSTSTATRAWIMRVAELSGRTKGAYEGIANPIAVQSRLTEYEGMRAKMTRDFYDAYKGWRQGFDIRGKEFENFSRNVSQAIVRNTFEDPSTDPHVAKAAKSIRDVISQMYGRAVEQGLIRADAWNPATPSVKMPFADIRARATDTTSQSTDVAGVGNPQDVVDYFLEAMTKPPRKKKKGETKFTKDAEDTVSIRELSPNDTDIIKAVAEDMQSGGAALTTREPKEFFREGSSRLARGGVSGERGLDYNVGLNFRFGPNGELGDDLVQRGGLINRRYTDRVSHERDEFLRAETLAYLQDRDVQIKEGRALNAENIRKAREDAVAKGEDPDAAEKLVELVDTGEGKLWHEMNRGQKRATLISGVNHSKGSWEFIVHGTIKGGDSKVMALEAGTGRSPLHRRNVLLSDQVLLAKGWIDDDALGIANHTVRQIASDVELARVFRRPMTTKEANDAQGMKPNAWWADGVDKTTVPDLSMQVPRKVIGEDFANALRQLDEAQIDVDGRKLTWGPELDAARNRLITERARILGGQDANGRQVQGYLDVVTEMIRGTHKIAENSTPTALNLQAAKSYMFAARMGANVVTNLGDIGALVLRHGIGDLMKHYAVRAGDMMRSLADGEALANLATKWELPQDRAGAILAREARAAGIAVETDLMSRMASQMDLVEPFRNAKAKDTVFQQGADWLARSGSKVYLINVWTNAIRKAAYGIYTDRVIRMAMDPANISKHERVWLDDLGLDDKMLKSIRREVEENDGAVLDGGVWHVLADNWKDVRVRSDFWAAGRKDVNTANVSPSQVEKPLAFTNPIVNTMLQFWSFSFGATMRITGQSAQRVLNGTDGVASDGTRVLLGLAAMVGLGMGTFALHNYASTWRQRQTGTLDPKDELPQFDENWRQWMMQGLSRSGVGGVFLQAGDVLDNLGVNPVTKAMRSFDVDPDATDPIKKYGRPNAVKNVMGPTAGLMDDLINAGRGIAYGSIYADEDIKRSNVRAIQRNLPFINAFYLKSLTREATEYLNDDVFKLPPDRR